MKTDSSLDKEIIGLEKKYWQAMKDKDLDAALSLTDFPCIVAGARGSFSVDRGAFIKMFKSGEQDVLEKFDFVDKPDVRQVSPDTAVIAYKVESTTRKGGKKDKKQTIDTSTWIKREGKWVCALHTETELLEH